MLVPVMFASAQDGGRSASYHNGVVSFGFYEIDLSKHATIVMLGLGIMKFRSGGEWSGEGAEKCTI